MEKSGNEFKDIIDKVEFLDKQLQKDHFSNPIREALIGIRSSLIEIAEGFEKKYEELDDILNQANVERNVTDEVVRKDDNEAQLLSNNKDNDKRDYQILHLCRSFDKYESDSRVEIAQLKQQVAKDEYRINFLLRTIESLENDLKQKNGA